MVLENTLNKGDESRMFDWETAADSLIVGYIFCDHSALSYMSPITDPYLV